MENIPWDLVVAFACGMVVMYAFKNPQGTARFIRGLIGRAGRGAKNLNEQSSGGRGDGRREPPRDDRYDDRDRRDDRDVYPRRPLIPHRREVTCDRCRGSGRIKPSSMDFSGQATRKCPDCKGYGTIEVEGY